MNKAHFSTRYWMSLFILLAGLVCSEKSFSQNDFRWQDLKTDKIESKDVGIQGEEVVSRRTWNSKTFINENGTATLEITASPQHYQDENGRWQDIDLNVRLASDSTRFEANKGLYRACFTTRISKKNTTEFETFDADRSYFHTRITRMGYYDEVRDEFYPIEEARAVQGRINANTVLYREIFDGIDLCYTNNIFQLKEEFILSEKCRDRLPSPKSLGLASEQVKLVFESSFSANEELDAYAEGEKISSEKESAKKEYHYKGKNSVVFNKGEKCKYVLAEDYAFYTTGSEDSLKERSGKQVWKKLTSTKEGNWVYLGVPYQWIIEAPAGAVVIDPTVTIQPDPTLGKDTFIYKDGGGNDDYGAYTTMQVGPDRTTYERRGIILFDLSCIPPNAGVSSATLNLYLYTTWGVANKFTIETHKMTRSWVEGTGSAWDNNLTTGTDWLHANEASDLHWNTAGMGTSDYQSTVLDTEYVRYSVASVWKSWNVVSAVQSWVATPATNYGLALITMAADISKNVGAAFWSSDYTTTPSLRPKLVVSYTVDPLATFEYDALSRLSKAILANGVEETDKYDARRHWLTRKAYRLSSDTLFTFKNTSYDAMGNLLRADYRYKAESYKWMQYGYNALNRLTSYSDSESGSDSYVYDANGNITSFDGRSFLYESKNNRMTKDGSSSYGFDTIGRVTSAVGSTVTYDLFSNMKTHGTNSYSYDAFGQRIKKTENSVATYYITSGEEVLSEYDNGNNLKAEYIYPMGRIVAKLDPAQGYLWFYPDHLGSARLVDGSGGETYDMRRDYYPYGANKVVGGNNHSAYQFSGKELDSGIGLYYFGARYYNPAIGRWYVPDPAGQGWSPYAYCGNSPLICVDENGNIFFLAPILIGAAIGGSINLGIQAWQGNIHNPIDAIAAFGIGAFAGAAAVAVPQAIGSLGGIGLTTGTGSIASGFVPGAVAGFIGGALNSFGNALYFQDMDLGDAALEGLKGAGIGAATGGLIGGGIAKLQGKSFWGPRISPSAPIQSDLTVFEPKLDTPRRLPMPDYEAQLYYRAEDVYIGPMEKTVDGIRIPSDVALTSGTMQRTGVLLEMIRNGQSGTAQNFCLKLAQTPTGKVELSQIHLTVSKLMQYAKSPEALNIMRNLQGMTKYY